MDKQRIDKGKINCFSVTGERVSGYFEKQLLHTVVIRDSEAYGHLVLKKELIKQGYQLEDD